MNTLYSPVAGEVRLGHHDRHGAGAVAVLDRGDPVFAGHYPSYPVVPGVLLIDFVRLTVLAWQHALGAGASTVDSVDSVDRCRFRDPVRPGDEIVVHLTGSPQDGPVDAEVRVQGGVAAEIRMTFRGSTR
jgi:3-hydroxyacyl-[acyl-carrier-protein] dehydratase